jgi:hypothetical protein
VLHKAVVSLTAKDWGNRAKNARSSMPGKAVKKNGGPEAAV